MKSRISSTFTNRGSLCYWKVWTRKWESASIRWEELGIFLFMVTIGIINDNQQKNINNNKTFQRQSTAEGIEAPDGKNVGKSWTRVWSPGRRVYPCIWLVHYFIIDWVLGPQEPLGTLLSDWINALTTKPFACFRESVKKVFFWEISPKSV